MMDHSLLTQKTAVSFAKTGPAIYHSHHDMIRFWERAVKRARLPMRLTQGFNPRPRMIFPHALGVGIASRHEEVELELCATVGTDDLTDRLVRVCGDTLEILGVRNLPPVKKSRQLVASSYRITGWPEAAAGELERVAGEIVAMPEIIVERGAPGDKRSLDIRPFLKALGAEGPALLLELSHSQAGSGRPDEITKLAAGKLDVDWRDLFVEKTSMQLV